MTTGVYFNYGAGTQIELRGNTEQVTQRGRWSNTDKVGTDNQVHQNLGKADREWEIKGGPITITELGYIKGFAEGTTTITYRGPITNNADVNVIVEWYQAAYTDFETGHRGVLDATHAIWVWVKVRESV
jgi:hypothetical protein